MIDAGLPLVQCLEILGTQKDNPNFQKVLLHVRQDVEGGASLADAMKKHPKVFDDLFTNMIAAGEAGGILDTILKRLATYIEKSVKLKSQVKSALVYPAAVISIAGLVVGVILWKVIPTFASLFAGLGAQLPLPTRIVIGLSNWLVRLMLPMVIGGVVGRLLPEALLRDLQGSAGHRPDHAPGAGDRHDPSQDRRRPLLPDALDPHLERRPHPRRARDHRQDLGQRHRRRRDHGDEEERRGRSVSRRSRSSRRTYSLRWWCR